MLLFCDGMPRSASTWIYNVVFALLKAAFPTADIRRAVYVSPATFDTIGDGADWALLKCHRLDESTRALFRAGNARAIYTHRDIYDAMASYLVMFRVSFELSIGAMRDSLDAYDFHHETGNFLSVDYESIVQRPLDAVHAIAGFIGIDLPASEIALIEQAHSLQAIKELCANLKQLDERELVRDPLSCYHADTQWHVRHVRNGGIGYGRRYLSPQQIDRIYDLIRSRRGPSRNLLPKVPDSPVNLSAAG
jgi:hypothetical protein